MYKLIGTSSVQRLEDGACIPFADGNRDYEAYKIWLEEGNTPEPEFTDIELDSQRIAKIKARAGEIILSRYPQYKQTNAQLGVYGKDYLTDMTKFIKDIINQSTELEKSGKTSDDFVIGE